VQVASDNDYYGLYAADVLNLTAALALSLSARLNEATIVLQDRLGSTLNGRHSFGHFNPAAGLTYKLLPEATLYVGFAEANRAPTPAEFSCASASAPCSLTNFFVADPALKQVTAQTFEAGARGELQQDGATIHWHAGVYRVDSSDDIMFVASPIIGRVFFHNIGETRRQGLEASADTADGPWLASLNYAYTDATFQTALALASPDNPRADANGQIHVVPGDRLTSIPKHVLKLALTYQAGDAWNVTLSGHYASGQYLRGDESNLNPQTQPYFVLTGGATYRLRRNLELIAEIENLLDAKYETFGTFSPIGDVPIAQVPNASNPRSLSPGAPRTIYAGVRAWL
jgi:iron complex outermembrane receptor protein